MFGYVVRRLVAGFLVIVAVSMVVAGTVFTEKIFGIQGLGLAALDAVQRTDLPIISATVLIGATLIVVANIVVDVLYSVIDPRVRLT